MVVPVAALPDPVVLEQVATALVTEAPADWTGITMIMFYEAPDVYEVRMWTATPGGRARVAAPLVFRELAAMRRRQIAAGQEPWLRCDLVLTRAPGSPEPDFRVDFAYEVGDVPDEP